MFPDILKSYENILIHKNGDTTTCNNYRPIFILSNLSKIFETLMHTRIYNFLNKFKCIDELQFRFRNKNSNNHILIQITEKNRETIDNNNDVCGDVVDLQKAFDTVNHQILLEKLNYIRGTQLSCFATFLQNRIQSAYTITETKQPSKTQ